MSIEMVQPVALKDRYFDDFSEGEIFEFGDYLVTQEELIDFSIKFDPQLFHLDPEAAKESVFGELVASGWMTGAIMCRLVVDHFLSPAAAMGSPGLNSLSWIKPVCSGDRLSQRVTILKCRRSVSKPDRGVLELLQEGFNQDGELVISMTGIAMMGCR